MSKRTPLYDEHVRRGGRMVDFHGWELPVQYAGILAEHRGCRESAALFDTSHMGQLRIRASGAALGRVTTQDAAALGVGRGRYGFLLDECGGILDDTVLMRLAEEDFLLAANSATAEADAAWVRRHLAEGEVVVQSAEGWGKLDLQGPLSAQVLAPHSDADLRALRYFSNAPASVCGHPCVLSRTGYTGEMGYEIFAPAEAIVAVFRELLADERAVPAGLGARDSLRLEMGYPLFGEDMDAATTPFEANAAGFVALDREFVGAEALRRLASEAPERLLVAFASESRQRPRAGGELRSEGRAVGVVTSAGFSPSLEVSIAMGYVPPALAAAGTRLAAETRRGELTVTVTDTPLYTHGTCRTRELL